MSPVALVAPPDNTPAVRAKRGWVRSGKPKPELTAYQKVFKAVFGSVPLTGDSLKKRPKNGVGRE